MERKIINYVNQTPENTNPSVLATLLGDMKTPKPLTYDYMPEGYPSKSVQTVTLLEAQEVAFASVESGYAAQLTEALAITEGQTYTVNWDGTEYECVCSVLNSTPILGNLSIMDVGDDTGEPFIYISVERMFGTLDTSASHTIGVKTVTEVITPMAYDYMPEGYPKKRGCNIEWDGNTEGLVSVLEMFYKVSDLLPTDDELIGSTIELSNRKKVEITSDMLNTTSEDITFIGKGDLLIAVVKKDNAIFKDTTFPQKGTYFAKQQNMKVSKPNSIYVKKLTGAITPMAEEFMPPRIVEAIDAVGAVANAAQTTANAAQTTANAAQTTAENVQRTASAKFQLMQQNTVTTTTTIGTINNSVGSVPVKGLNIAVGSTIKFTADNNVSGETVWDRPVKKISMQNSAGVTICSLRLELSHDGETYNFTNETLSSILSNLVIEYEKVIILKLTYPARNEGAWLPPYLIANCLYLTKQSTTSSAATLYRITVDNSGTLSATEVTT